MIEVTNQEKALAKTVVNMLLNLRILPNTGRLADYERAKLRWAEVCGGEYEAGVQYIADYVGV